jgi:outer membrane protein OmpA-like peptidoglycan-associated protein
MSSQSLQAPSVVPPQTSSPSTQQANGVGGAGVGTGLGGGVGNQARVALLHAKPGVGVGSDVADPAREQSDREKAALLASVYGPRNLAHAVAVGSGTGIGGFEATYIPFAETLLLRVTGKVQFRDAVSGAHPSFTTQHSDLSALVSFLNSLPAAVAAQVLPFFQWNDALKQEKLTQFNARLAEAAAIWQNAGLHFEVDDPLWSDVRAAPLFSLSVGDEGTAGADEHLQVTIYKEPTPEERAQMNAILARAGQAPANAGMGIRASAGTNLNSNTPGASGNATDENALQNEMSLSSSDLDARPDEAQRGGNNLLKRSVMFANNVKSLTPQQNIDIQAWIGGFTSGDSNTENDAITLRGFASSAGSAEYNQSLVDGRIASVQSAVTGAGIPAARIRTDNRGSAEAAGVGSEAEAQANERRVEIRIGSGERQNTVAHEFGHVFGLSDEYSEGTRSPGQASWQDPTVRAAGVSAGSKVENNDGIQSMGNTVRPQHYATFAWALNQLTQSKLGSRVWHVK